MMSLNDNEKDFQKKLQEETEIPVIVHERVNQAYRLLCRKRRQKNLNTG